MTMDSSPRSKPSEPSLPAAAGVKRPAPSLLPAFEPLSSSPALPRPLKRQARAGSIGQGVYKYPTPVPTSSTGILSSSPPRVGSRPALQRTQSTVSERAPLSAVPSIELNENGEVLLMGRSSNSSHYQLSANRLISRVHVKARYVPATDPLESNKIEIVCNGWNGLKVHCQARTWELAKGDTFTSETENTEIMLDVQDARVLIHWPKRDRHESLANLSDSSWDDSPRARPAASGNTLQSSPLRRTTRIASPESPTPANLSASSIPEAVSAHSDGGGEQIQIYEDGSSDEPELPKISSNPNESFLTEVTQSFSSELSDPAVSDEDHENDPDEENDPIVHSFGPFGANLSNRMASFTTTSPKTRPLLKPGRRSVSSNGSTAVASASGALSSALAAPETSARSSISITSPPRGLGISTSGSRSASTGSKTPIRAATPQPPLEEQFDVPAISNHVVNQLAYSRLSSTPLSAILSHLPSEERHGDLLTKDKLRMIIEGVACIGTIARQGKDAAGKPLESEYYYVPERDEDDHRRLAVTDGLRKPSLRNCRKQHKQYYWKRPRTP